MAGHATISFGITDLHCVNCAKTVEKGLKSQIGLFRLEDAIRADTADSVERLKKSGIRIVMLTGDNVSIAGTVAGRTGVDDFHAGLLPAQKTALIKSLQSDGSLRLRCHSARSMSSSMLYQ